MSDCECLPKCVFFHDQMADMPATAESMKRRFCRGDSSGCARHMVFAGAGKEKVPADLYPNNVNRAQLILAEL